jgi:hypothetical protein
MRYRGYWLIPWACMLASGCAVAPHWPGAITTWLAPDTRDAALTTRSLIDAWDDDGLPDEYDLAPYVELPQAADFTRTQPIVADDVADSIEQAPPGAAEAVPSMDASCLDQIDKPYEQAAQYLGSQDAAEPIATPPAAARSPFRYQDGEDDLDRFNRRLQDVPLDVRPTQGTLPTPPAIAERADQPHPVDVHDGEGQPLTLVSCTPWTFCYRPLYFEEINLERYGCSAGILQPGISGAHFFGTVALLPYKMVLWPPRSCVCSNGFSRCTDCRPPGYRECVWSWSAAAVEAGIVAGIVLALP